MLGAMLFSLCTWAQANGSASSDVVRTIEHPDFSALFTFGIEISKVEFGKEQTTLYFDFSHYTSTSFGFRSTTYLVDEEGKRYPIKSCKGFQLDKGYNVKEDGVKEISISFEPLPEGTRVFDCIEGPDLQWSFQFYGIREKGQDWNVFPKKDVADNPFPESFFCVDTVYVTGRITQSKYDRESNACRHESYSEEALRKQFRLGGGAFDRFYVAKDGTFSFKTIVVKPTMDELFIPGGRIPVLLIPGDHLQVDISHWGEYNQQVTIRSEKGDYSRLLTNYPFLYEKEIADPRGTLSWSETGKLAADTWQPLHDELETRMEVCRYLAAKHHFTPTEQKLIQMNVQIDHAFIAYMRMLSPLMIKYRKVVDLYNKDTSNNKKYPKRRFSMQELEADSISLDLSFITECHWDDPTISATKDYEVLLSKLPGLFTFILFQPGTEAQTHENDSINTFAAAERLGIGETLIGEYLTTNMYDRLQRNPELRQKVRGIVENFKSPHTRILSKAALDYDLHDYEIRSYPANQSIAADVIKKLYAPYKGKKVLLLPLSCYRPDGLQKIDSLYQARRAEIDKEAVFLPVATPKFTSKQELKELQQKYPTLKNTVYLGEEELLRLYIAFQRGNGPQTDPEMLILQDGTFGIPGYLFLDNYRKKK